MIIGKELQKENSAEKQYSVLIDNGDLELLNSLVSAYSFKDKDSLIKFAISALLEGNNTEGLFIVKTVMDEGGIQKKTLSKLNPPLDLLASRD